MSFDVLALVIAAAFAHAGWNLVAKGAQGGAAFVWWCAVAGTVLYVPILAFFVATDPGPLGWTAVALMAGSGVLHAASFVLLQRGYAIGDLSAVYPLARGTGPLLSTAVAIAVLGERPGPAAIAGGALIVVAVFSLGGVHTSRVGRSTVYAVLTGSAIAAYTLWDKHAVGVGLLSPLAYVLILYALARAPVSYVAPARKSSIVIGTLLGALVLHEGHTRRRVAAAGAILVGIVALTLA